MTFTTKGEFTRSTTHCCNKNALNRRYAAKVPGWALSSPSRDRYAHHGLGKREIGRFVTARPEPLTHQGARQELIQGDWQITVEHARMVGFFFG